MAFESEGWFIGNVLGWVAFAALVVMTCGFVQSSAERYVAVLAWEGLAIVAYLSRLTPNTRRQ